jgi:glycerate kinase|tara:strand:- start:288 stop:1448 length:1161 start_codon:yes stop_codon:yes gene_type:complete
MKIVVAPQAFKGSLSATEVGNSMIKGIENVIANSTNLLVPIADGGDGTLETLVESSQGKINLIKVTGPLGEQQNSAWGALGRNKTAIIEMARSSGLALVPINKLNPLISTTYGLGEVILDALDQGYRDFIIGIGGSATNDAGAGMAQALGAKLLDSNGNELPFGGESLSKLNSINIDGIDTRIKESNFAIACDVNNPLTGPEGASAIYGPQKGATPEMVNTLDQALTNFAKIVEKDLGIKINNVEGSGAAGGLGGGLIAFLNGKLRKGVDIVLDFVDIDKALINTNLVITGEGQLDFQTIYNKAPIGVAKRAKHLGIPVIAISGSLGENFSVVHEHGIDAASSIVSKPMTLEEASKNAPELISTATEQALRYMKIGSDVFKTNIKL